ncbi:hypothetical protein HAX54_036836 [Datura stramonium]|uniref:Uncharacterized protein n=1 Tax=Datura stramonium TaxID=4076 RepID=A0ABS8RP44_DATST|nr:hypothetical protein [Datura stramonium]
MDVIFSSYKYLQDRKYGSGSCDFLKEALQLLEAHRKREKEWRRSIETWYALKRNLRYHYPRPHDKGYKIKDTSQNNKQDSSKRILGVSSNDNEIQKIERSEGDSCVGTRLLEGGTKFPNKEPTLKDVINVIAFLDKQLESLEHTLRKVSLKFESIKNMGLGKDCANYPIVDVDLFLLEKDDLLGKENLDLHDYLKNSTRDYSCDVDVDCDPLYETPPLFDKDRNELLNSYDGLSYNTFDLVVVCVNSEILILRRKVKLV